METNVTVCGSKKRRFADKRLKKCDLRIEEVYFAFSDITKSAVLVSLDRNQF